MTRLVDRKIIEKRLAQLEHEISILENNLEEKIYKRKMAEAQFTERIDVIDDCLTEISYCMEADVVALDRRREKPVQSVHYEILSNHG